MENQPITKSAILAENHATGSNQQVIQWEVDINKQVEADHEWVIGWNLASMIEQDEEAAGKLWMELVKKRAHLDAGYMEDEVEQEAKWFQKVLGKALDTTGKKMRIYTQWKRWWNVDIKMKRNRPE